MTRLATKNYKGMTLKEVKALFRKERCIPARDFLPSRINGILEYYVEYDINKMVCFEMNDNGTIEKVVTYRL